MCSKWKKKIKTSGEKKKNKTEISNLPDKFKVTVIKLLAELRRTMEEYSENFNKDLENISKYLSEINNKITTVKSTSEGINRSLDDTEEQISQLGGRVVEITQLKQQN